MKRTILAWVVVCLVSLVGAIGMMAQSETNAGASAAPSPSVAAGPTASMLRLIKFSGSAADAQGRPLQGTVGVTFALYADQQGGTPLWLETQNVTLDKQGRYTALLGAMSNEGLPLDIFASGEARWLGITVQGQTEQPRVLLVAVPYALKAAEAETLSGKKASDFVTTEQLPEQVQKVVQEQKTGSATTSASSTTTSGGGKTVVTSGATNFTDTTTDQVVKVTQNGTGYALLGIGTSSNGIFGATQAANANVYGIFGQTIGQKGGALIGFANSTTGTAVGVQGVSKSATGTAGAFVNTAGGRVLIGRGAGNTEVFHVNGDGGGFFNSEVGIGTSTPEAKLHLQSTTGENTIRMTETSGTNMANSGTIEFLETTGTFGVDTLGFRMRYDGNTNNFLVQSDNFGTVLNHLVMSRNNSNVGINTDPTAFQTAAQLAVNTTTGGKILSGQNSGSEVFSVDANGVVAGLGGQFIFTAAAGGSVAVDAKNFGSGSCNGLRAILGSDFGAQNCAAVFAVSTDSRPAGIFRSSTSSDILEAFSNNGTVVVKDNGDVTTTSNFVALNNGQGLILKSPNGSVCRLLGIDNSGAITLTVVSCP